LTPARANLGGLDILVANAVIASSAPIEETTVELWRNNYDVLAEGYCLTARAAFPMMKTSGGGSIVFIGSKNGIAVTTNVCAYASAKAAANHLARCLALEGARHGIRVNVVNPDAVISDWGSSILAAQELGPKAQCLVDLGHHAPNVNIEQTVAPLHRFGKLGGFYFNDSKYGDDVMDSGSVNPHQLFLVFNELVEAELNPRAGFSPAYMIDQSHNVTDPIESMVASVDAIVTSYAKALLVDRAALTAAQNDNDTMLAFQALRGAYKTDVSPYSRHRAAGGKRRDRHDCHL
jgi:short chain dehydrogenase